MSVAALREEVASRSREFAWDQWTQIGVSGHAPAVADRSAIDPEALLLFTLEAARTDPRLFDEVLDWLVLNEQLISVQRLRNLCVDDADRQLVDAALASVARWRPRARLSGARRTTAKAPVAQSLFYGLSTPTSQVDSVFAAHGFLRAPLEPSRKSDRPDLHAPVAFAFRLRRLLGLGVRAEVVRALLTIDAPRVSAGVLHASAGFSRQNVRESLHQLGDADVLVSTGLGSEQFLAVRHDDWAQLLGINREDLPAHRDWIQVLGALRIILRWLQSAETDELSDYMRASEARQLLGRFAADLRFAGVQAGGASPEGAAYWEEFVRAVRALLAVLP